MKNTGLGLILTMLLAATVASAADLDALTNDESSRVREKAAWALGRIGADAKPALDELKKASTSDKSKRVKGRCLESLTRIKKDLAGNGRATPSACVTRTGSAGRFACAPRPASA